MTKTEIYYALNKLLTENKNDLTPELLYTLSDICKELVNDIGGTINAESDYCPIRALKIARKMLADNAKSNKSPSTQYVSTDKTGKQCILDGYMLFRFNEPLDLPSMPESVKPFDVDRIMQPATLYDYELPSITLPELKIYIAQHKEQAKANKEAVIYDFGFCKPAVNANYLATVLSLFPDAKLYFDGKTLVSAIYIKSAHGDGVILPVLSAAKKKQIPAVEIIARTEKPGNSPYIDIDELDAVVACL